ncbi:hypothetical protein KIPB_008255, partial [Kipferlia bialata]|eukprot:g8255.t1
MREPSRPRNGGGRRGGFRKKRGGGRQGRDGSQKALTLEDVGYINPDLDVTAFEKLGLNENTLHGVRALGFGTPTEIQERSCPPVLEGKDVVGCAQTGTGKTAAFMLPTL